jgi:hypothetical protein
LAQDLNVLGRLLQSVLSPPQPSAEEMAVHGGRCNYDDFCQLREQAPLTTRRFLTVQHFLRV